MTGDQQILFPPEAPKRQYTLSPSEFGFLWQECKRCYYLKVTQKFARPGVFPKIFTAIDNQMRQRFEGQRTEKVAPDLPPGVFDCRDQWVASSPIAIPGRNSLCIVRGKIDALVRFDSGGFAVVDFKTSSQSDRNVATYTRQLSAYAYALENAPVGQTALRPVQRLGLLVFDPKQFLSEKGGAELKGSLTWAEIPRDDAAFLKFLDEVMTVLDLPAAPPPTAGCAWCAYREAARQNLY
jgi:PD-(D/E)XK nuclease superfamily protein